MNSVDLQLDFYRRFNDAASRLVITESRYMLPLLGTPHLSGSKFIGCSLSMGVRAAARRLNSGMILIENTKSSIGESYNINELFRSDTAADRKILSLFKKTGFNGAQILYDCDIPQGYDYQPALRCAMLKAIISMNAPLPPAPEDAEVIHGDSPELYKAMIGSRRGWCTYADKTSVVNYPLPMTGLLVLTICTRHALPMPRLSAVAKELRQVRREHPLVTTYSDIEPDMLIGGDYLNLRHIAFENERINEACRVLKACNIDKFTAIVNDSSESAAQCLYMSAEQKFLTRQLVKTEGCKCAHPFESGVYAIIDERLADYIIRRAGSKFEDRFGYKPPSALSSTII